MILTATSGPIGGFTVEAGGSLTGTVAVTGATTSMSVSVSPTSYPGDGIVWVAYVSAPDVVTVKVLGILAGFIPARTYNVVASSGGGGGGLTLQTNGVPNGDQALLNLEGGTNVTLTDDGLGGVTIAASGGAGTVTHTGALTLNLPAFGNGAADIKAGTKTGNTNALVTANGAATSGAPLLYDASGNAIAGTKSGNTTELATVSGAVTTGDIATWDASGNLVDGGAPAAGTVTHTGALTADQPMFGNGAADSKVGTKTGNTTTLASATGATTANVPLLYDANGNVVVGTRSGNTTKFVSTNGALTSGDLASWDASGNAIDSAATVAKLSQNILTTKGDLLGFAAALLRVGVGADATVLTADSTQPAGIKWAAATGGGPVTLIQSIVAGGAVSTVNFAAIPATFTTLMLQIFGRSQLAAQDDDIYLQFNGDTSAAYSNERLLAVNATPISSSAVALAKPVLATIVAASGPASWPGVFTAYLPGYASTAFFKAAHAEGGWFDTAVGNRTIYSGNWVGWPNTAAVNAILLGSVGGANFVSGTTFNLYGLN